MLDPVVYYRVYLLLIVAVLVLTAVWAGMSHLKELSPGQVALFRDKLHARIKEAKVDVEVDDERLAKEVALFADRSDITEELVRLRAHFEQFAELLARTTPVGRELDFLMQEINRECNTIASKSTDREIAQCVVALKAEIERCREQAQNIE